MKPAERNNNATHPTDSKTNSRITLHRQLSDELLRRIRDGEYPVGSNLPTEAELCERFNVSRHTAREATRRLLDMGLVVRKPRAGTTVLRRYTEPKFGLGLENTEQLTQYLENTALSVHKVVSALTAHPPEAQLEGAPSDWLKVATFRCLPGTDRPISWTDIYLRKEYKAIVEHIGHQPGGVYPLFERYCNETVGTIDMEISATTFPATIAKRLGYTKSDPALLMLRRFRNNGGKLLEVAISYYPPYSFRYMTRLSRADGRYHTSA